MVIGKYILLFTNILFSFIIVYIIIHQLLVKNMFCKLTISLGNNVKETSKKVKTSLKLKQVYNVFF